MLIISTRLWTSVGREVCFTLSYIYSSWYIVQAEKMCIETINTQSLQDDNHYDHPEIISYMLMRFDRIRKRTD